MDMASGRHASAVERVPELVLARACNQRVARMDLILDADNVARAYVGFDASIGIVETPYDPVRIPLLEPAYHSPGIPFVVQGGLPW